MPFYVSIMEGPTPHEAVPLLATSDPNLVAAFAELIAQRLGVLVPGNILDLRRPPPREWQEP